MIKTPNEELNKDLGGGIQCPGVVLVYGNKGVGKAEILLSMAKYAAFMGHKVSFISHNKKDILYKNLEFYDQHAPLEKVVFSDVVFVDDYDLNGRSLKTIKHDADFHKFLAVIVPSRIFVTMQEVNYADLVLRVVRYEGRSFLVGTKFKDNLPLLGKSYGISFDQDHKDDHAGMIYNEYNDTWGWGF